MTRERLPPPTILQELLDEQEQMRSMPRSRKLTTLRLAVLGVRCLVDPDIPLGPGLQTRILTQAGTSRPTLQRFFDGPLLRGLTVGTVDRLIEERFRPRHNLLRHEASTRPEGPDRVSNMVRLYMRLANPAAALHAAERVYHLGDAGARDRILSSQSTALGESLNIAACADGYEPVTEKAGQDLLRMLGTLDVHNQDGRFTNFSVDVVHRVLDIPNPAQPVG